MISATDAFRRVFSYCPPLQTTVLDMLRLSQSGLEIMYLLSAIISATFYPLLVCLPVNHPLLTTMSESHPAPRSADALLLQREYYNNGEYSVMVMDRLTPEGEPSYGQHEYTFPRNAEDFPDYNGPYHAWLDDSHPQASSPSAPRSPPPTSNYTNEADFYQPQYPSRSSSPCLPSDQSDEPLALHPFPNHLPIADGTGPDIKTFTPGTESHTEPAQTPSHGAHSHSDTGQSE